MVDYSRDVAIKLEMITPERAEALLGADTSGRCRMWVEKLKMLSGGQLLDGRLLAVVEAGE